MRHPVDIHVGRKMRSAREQRGISQKSVAEKLNVSFQQYQKYESSTNRISASKLHEVSQILGVDHEYFFAGLGNGRTPTLTGQDHHNARQVLNLNQAFAAIDDANVRHRIVKMAQAIAERQ